jgi:hypothetical protein
MRYTTPPDEHRQSYFSLPPGEVNDEGVYKCEMYWGSAQEQIMKQLNDIVNGKS